MVLIKGRPLIINWAERNLPAIIDAGYPGMEGGNAVADVLCGDYNPAGRLSISVPRSVGQLPVFYNTKRSANRGKYINEGGEPLFQFGYGLSYTKFEYKDLDITISKEIEKSRVKVEVTVKNIGKVDCDEVVQIYLRGKVTSHTTPDKKLVAFKRVNIKSGEVAKVTFVLDNITFEIYQGNGKWKTELGEYKFMVGGSLINIALEKEIYLDVSNML